MPLPIALAPLVPIALRLGAVAAAGFALRRVMAANTVAGRTDQRAEDALDALDEGLAVHSPSDRSTAGENQTNTAARLRRTIRWGKRGIEIDAALFARFRVRRV